MDSVGTPYRPGYTVRYGAVLLLQLTVLLLSSLHTIYGMPSPTSHMTESTCTHPLPPIPSNQAWAATPHTSSYAPDTQGSQPDLDPATTDHVPDGPSMLQPKAWWMASYKVSHIGPHHQQHTLATIYSHKPQPVMSPRTTTPLPPQ